jgi:hypothetical protein
VPSEPLLLYIAATSEIVSMVLVAERPDPHAPHELRSSSADGSGSLDLRPVEEPGAADGSGSQDPQPTEEPGANVAAKSQSLEAAMAPLTRVSRGPQVQSSCQTQRAGSSWACTPGNGCAGTPPPWRARTIQRSVYFISEVLYEAKTRYLEVHKLLYAVLIASKKLLHYF